jgi:hypothetical protein
MAKQLEISDPRVTDKTRVKLLQLVKLEPSRHKVETLRHRETDKLRAKLGLKDKPKARPELNLDRDLLLKVKELKILDRPKARLEHKDRLRAKLDQDRDKDQLHQVKDRLRARLEHKVRLRARLDQDQDKDQLIQVKPERKLKDKRRARLEHKVRLRARLDQDQGKEHLHKGNPKLVLNKVSQAKLKDPHNQQRIIKDNLVKVQEPMQMLKEELVLKQAPALKLLVPPAILQVLKLSSKLISQLSLLMLISLLRSFTQWLVRE